MGKFVSGMDAFEGRDQNTDTMEEGDRSRIDLSQHVDHSFNAALLIG
jgi:hypothetical protein